MQKTCARLLIAGIFCALLMTGCGTKKEYPPSEVIIEGEYILEGTENIDFIFSKNSTLTVLQSGIYEFGKDDEGRKILRICFDDISRELPEDYNYTDYLVEQRRKCVYLTFVTEDAGEEQQPMALKLLEGTDGLSRGEFFDGTYQIGEKDKSYQYIFSQDGTVVMQIIEYYYAKDNRLTLSDASGSTDYKYELTKEQMKINNLQGEMILSLQKKDD